MGWSCAALLTWSCGGKITDRPSIDGPGAVAGSIALESIDGDALRGARLYDNFYMENPTLGFTPDGASAPVLDGTGGPSADGTLRDGEGGVLDNSLGHDYRLSSFFGWDLRGAEGIHGGAYRDKAYVAQFSLIDDALSREQVAAIIVDGAPGLPAYGGVLPQQDLADVVAFIMAVRDGGLPQSGDVWHLDGDAAPGYVLKPGGRVELGHATIRASCSGCHGADGTSLPSDDSRFSLGSLARGKADEVWFKIVAGSAGTEMASQIPVDEPWWAQAQMVLDVLGALCDRAIYPDGEAGVVDVSSSDGCGYYRH